MRHREIWWRRFALLDLDAVIEWDVNLEHGVTRENLDAAVGIWQLILDQYTTYIGFK